MKAGKHVAYHLIVTTAVLEADPMTATPIVDPEDENRAIMPDGGLGFAVRLLPHPVGPGGPTAEELRGGVIVGYGRFDEDYGKKFSETFDGIRLRRDDEGGAA